MIFIDWLTIHQEHMAGGLPVVGQDLRCGYDLATGQLVYSLVTGLQFEGSHETSVRVRCDGRRVEVSGNPSAFARADNLYGIASMVQCIDVYNAILLALGLPVFSNFARPAPVPGHRFHRHATPLGMQNPVITRVDLTENFETPDARLYLRNLSSYVHQGKAGFLFPDGLTVDWNGKANSLGEGASKRVYVKYYVKETDLDNKIVKLHKTFKKSIQLNEIADYNNRHEYLQAIKAFSGENHIVRHEVTLKAKYLAQHGLNTVERWSESAMTNIIRPYQFHNRLKVEQTDIQNNVAQLMALGVEERVARRADVVFNAWLQGKDLHYKNGGLAKNTFYRMRQVLLLVGVDIAIPCQISHVPLQSVKMYARPIDPPEWYKMPVVPELGKPVLSLVA